MKTIYVKYYDLWEIFPDDVISELTDEEIIKECFRASEFQTEAHALSVYANTKCTWSTLLDAPMTVKDVKNWIKEAYKHIKANDIDWLEENFV